MLVPCFLASYVRGCQRTYDALFGIKWMFSYSQYAVDTKAIKCNKWTL